MNFFSKGRRFDYELLPKGEDWTIGSFLKEETELWVLS